ncbi:hypothetical protein F4777DRAFT_578250 [Nemania sp. FL0916]|nr:hypothetical protein F4777DRAFT_578250 [Nemania sp. FL0916]
MQLRTILYALAIAGITDAFGIDIRNFKTGVYKIPIGFTGNIEYESAEMVPINITHGYNLANRTRKRARTSLRLEDTRFQDIDYDDDDEEEEEEDDDDDDLFRVSDKTPDGHEVDDMFRVSDTDDDDFGDEYNANLNGWKKGFHCHGHLPKRKKLRFKMGLVTLNTTDYPLTSALLANWMEGEEWGFTDRDILHIAKSDSLVLGVCVYKKRRLRTCPHELRITMELADKECGLGKVGCHVCNDKWYKDYFRFDPAEAPSVCECGWYHW